MTAERLVWLAGLIWLAIYAQHAINRERAKSAVLAQALVSAHEWVDEIIQALQDPDVDRGDSTVHRLAAQFSDDERPVLP